MERSRIAIVIPALNEESSVVRVVSKVAAFGIPIVVDDGSTDRTAELAQEAGAEVIRHQNNSGYDEALNSGFRHADDLGVEAIISIDADGQHDPSLLLAYLKALDDGADVVLGVRQATARWGEKIFALLANRRYGLLDPLCGMKAYRISVYRAHGCFDSYGSIGTELSLFAAQQGYRLCHIPIQTRPRKGMSRFGRSLAANRRILRALWLGLYTNRAQTATQRARRRTV